MRTPNLLISAAVAAGIWQYAVVGHAALVGPPPAEIGALLAQTEQQLASGHTLTPPGDNAVETWKQIFLVSLTSDSPAVRDALTQFAARLRTRAAAETAAGHVNIGTDMTVFANQASRLFETKAPLTQETPRPTAEPQVAVAPSLPSPVIPSATASKPPASDAPSVARITVAPLAAPLTDRPPAAPLADRPADNNADRTITSELNAQRGDQLLAAKDVDGARMYYGYAAIAGNARAARALAQTFDEGSTAKPTQDATPTTPPTTRRVVRRHRKPRAEAVEDAGADGPKETREVQQMPVERSIPW